MMQREGRKLDSPVLGQECSEVIDNGMFSPQSCHVEHVNSVHVLYVVNTKHVLHHLGFLLLLQTAKWEKLFMSHL